MRRRRFFCISFFAALTAAFFAALPAAAQLRPQQEKRIEAALPRKAPAEPKKPRLVLIWNTPYMERSPHKGFSIPQGAYAMRRLGEKTGAFRSIVSDDIRLLMPDRIKRFDCIVMNNSSGPWTWPTDEAMKNFPGLSKEEVQKRIRTGFLKYVREGGGIVAYHYSIGADRNWPEFYELLGARYWGHPWNEEVGVRVEEPDHPLLAAFEGKNFRIAEEIFQFRDPYSRRKVRVLLSLDTAATNMKVKWIHRTDNDFALAWVKRYGAGRVFYCAFGHRTEIWWNPKILRFYLAAIQWAAGDLEAPADPRPAGTKEEK